MAFSAGGEFPQSQSQFFCGKPVSIAGTRRIHHNTCSIFVAILLKGHVVVILFLYFYFFLLTYLLTLACSPIQLAWLPGSVSFCPVRGLKRLQLDVSGDSGVTRSVSFQFDFIWKWRQHVKGDQFTAASPPANGLPSVRHIAGIHGNRKPVLCGNVFVIKPGFHGFLTLVEA